MRIRDFMMLVLVGMGGLQALSAQAIVLGGSDLFDESVKSVLKRSLESEGIAAKLDFQGTLAGLDGIANGTLEAALLAIPESGAAELDLRKYPVAYQIVAFMVHASNPVTELSFRQLAGLFRERGKIDTWSTLIDDPAWQERPVSLMVSRDAHTVTLELFNAMVLNGATLKPSVRYLSGDSEQLRKAIVEDPKSLLMVPAIEIQGPVKLLAIKGAEDGQAYTPSADNVYFGDYPLRLPFYLVVSKGMDEKILNALLKAVYSDSVASALAGIGCVPLPRRERQDMVARADQDIRSRTPAP